MDRRSRAIRRLLLPGLLVGTLVTARALAGAAAADGVPGILLSRQLMAQAGVKPGDVVTLAADAQGSGGTRFRVVAEYEPTPDPMKFSRRRLEARLHLPDLLALTADPTDPLASESVGFLNVAVANPKDAQAIAAEIVTRTPGLFARSTSDAPGGGEVFAVVERFHWAIAVVTVVGSTAFLLALMVIRAEERRDIVGILRLMGIPPRSILIEVLLEGLLIALCGAIFGVVVALLGQVAVNRFFQWRYDTTLTFVRVTARIAWQSVALAVPLGVCAGLAASWTLLRRDVVSLIRR